MTNDSADHARQSRFFAELGVVALVLLAVFTLVDRVIVPRIEPALVGEQVVDIQSADTLYAKLDYLRRRPGRRVALVGDSVILGLVLREHGDPQWQEHTLAAALQRRLEPQAACVVNLGFNGPLPADLAEVARLLRAARPDVVLADFGLRGFSADFAAADAVRSRPWLARMHLSDDGSCRLDPASSRWHDRVEAAGASWLLSYWQLYRLRELAHTALCDGSAADAMSRVRAWLAKGPPAPAGDLYELELLLKARARFASINLDPDNPQRRGFEEFLRWLHDADTRTLLFYTRENPAVRDALIEPASYQRLHQELHAILQPYLTPQFRYCAGIEHLDASHYLDHLHVDAEGYRRLCDQLWPDVCALLAPE